MADFRGMLCWEPAVAAATINTEAVSPSREVFLATHAPLRIKRARIMDERQLLLEGEAINEEEVLQDFMALRPDSGALLMPIVGDSGSGKSHLVRWVRERLASMAEGADEREVIYLEKSKTSLKAVISTLIAKAESSDLAQLKEDINRFTEDIDEESLARRILNELSEALEATSPNTESRPLARMLVGPGKLAALLLDPHVRAELLAPGKFVPELAHQLIHNRQAGQTDRPEGFSVSDLPLDIRDIQSASGMAQKLLGTISTRGDLQSIAVDLLNSHLEAAIKSAANLGAGRLLDAMKQVREEYHRQGKEIVLLIEDFALIQGVQRDLLDAVVEAANREGKTTLAPIRSLMAVTTGYFQSLPETALTRLQAATGYVYHLDVPFSAAEPGRSEIASFVGRYLNAGRVGREALERAKNDIPNKCTNCPLRAECHEAFGATADGYGLYPFNESALVRAVHSTAPQEKPWSFNPRTVLGSVVRPVLTEHSGAIRQGEFPDPSFRQRFRPTKVDKPLSRDVRNFVAENDHNPDSMERRNLVLEFWGDAPEHANSLHPTILDAFALQPLDGGHQPGRSAPATAPGQTGTSASRPEATPAKRDELPTGVQRMLETVDEWLTRDGGLDTATANKIRSAVSTAVVQRYLWNSPLMREQAVTDIRRAAWPPKATVVSIEGAKENLPGVENAPITFSRRPKDSWFFDSLLRAERNLPARAEDIRRLATLADKHQPDLTSRLQRHMEVSDDHLVIGFRASLLGAALAGRARPGMPAAQLIAAALDDGQEWRRGDSPLRTVKWVDALGSHLKARPELVNQLQHAVGIAQGLGGVNMVDAARVLPLLNKATSSWNWGAEVAELPKWVRRAVTGFASWPSLIEEQLARHEELLASIRGRHPRGTTGVQTMAAMRDALNAAREVGLPLTAEQTRQFETLLQRGGGATWQTISALEDDLAKAADETRDATSRHNARVIAAVEERGDSLMAIQQLLVASDEWLDAALASAESRSSGSAGDSAAEDVGQICVEWQALTAAPSADDDGEDW
ncbi:protein DpdH [Streptomyces sp. NBC_01381]|uniref:protein DpdH n=1 Tax=Streptomyces sp. NBC_01381 TaxID=2903845 RepID=UPI00224E996D|nr:protein DpdH [Streptomyces sp. NBC_01381]MCX4666519.1 protein DpdH [Streptomyces sp. NBC_01381]